MRCQSPSAPIRVLSGLVCTGCGHCSGHTGLSCPPPPPLYQCWSMIAAPGGRCDRSDRTADTGDGRTSLTAGSTDLGKSFPTLPEALRGDERRVRAVSSVLCDRRLCTRCHLSRIGSGSEIGLCVLISICVGSD